MKELGGFDRNTEDYSEAHIWSSCASLLDFPGGTDSKESISSAGDL